MVLLCQLCLVGGCPTWAKGPLGESATSPPGRGLVGGAGSAGLASATGIRLPSMALQLGRGWVLHAARFGLSGGRGSEGG
jgi:hypothetical protein